MNDKTAESLSALMDGEVDELELRRLLKQVPEDGNVLDTWQRYHLVRASLRQELHSRPGVDLLGGIRAALENEARPVPAADDRAGPASAVVRYLGQGAIAASVAVVVLMTANTIVPRDGGTGLGVSEATADVSSPLARTTGEFEPGALTRMASFSDRSGGSGDPALDEEARDRLKQAVYREFQEIVPASYEIPVTYTVPAEQ